VTSLDYLPTCGMIEVQPGPRTNVGVCKFPAVVCGSRPVEGFGGDPGMSISFKRLVATFARSLGLETVARSWCIAGSAGICRRRPIYPSETSKCRARLTPYCAGYGLDVGCGGDPIVGHALRMDLPTPYARYT